MEGAQILIFGGGTVAARKASALLPDADVVAIGREFSPAFDPAVELILADLDPVEVERWIRETDPFMVIAATDTTRLNEAIEAAAHEQGILVNRADRRAGHGPGDVVMPGSFRDEPVIVSIGTHGRSPTVSRFLRQQLTEEWAGAGNVAEALAIVREEQLGSLTPDDRRDALRGVVSSPALWEAARNGRQSAINTARQLIDEWIESASSDDLD